MTTYAICPTDSRDDHSTLDAQNALVVAGPNSPAVIGPTPPIWTPLPGSDLPADQARSEPHRSCVGGDQTSGTHTWRETQPRLGAGSNFDGGHARAGAHGGNAAVEQTGNGSPAAKVVTTPNAGPLLADPFLALAADVLDDAERNRIANENRLRQLTRSESDSDGEERGFGLDESHPDVARLAAIVDMLAKVEHQSSLNLQRMLRNHPLGPWVKAQKGIGDKQAARLLAVIGDPYVNHQTGQPRTVSQLWAYCGHGDPSRKRRKGMTQADLFALGNPVAKSRLWLIACACLKAQGHYADVYYARKAASEERLHGGPCVRCGPSGKPAAEGTPWSAAHRHADALRIVGKEILRDLWLEAKRIHDSLDGQATHAIHGRAAVAGTTCKGNDS